jgi:hypothetical protein
VNGLVLSTILNSVVLQFYCIYKTIYILPQNAIFPSIFKLKFWAWNAGDELFVNNNFEQRRRLSKLRISAHKLQIEIGRYQDTLRENRICCRCTSGQRYLSIVGSSLFKIHMSLHLSSKFWKFWHSDVKYVVAGYSLTFNKHVYSFNKQMCSWNT